MGMGERTNRTFLVNLQAMIKESDVSYWHWGEAVMHAAYLYNRIASHALDIMRPFESLFRKVSKMNRIRVFGFQFYKYTQKVNINTKLHAHAESRINLGVNGGLYKAMLLRSG